jgi:hypothetical protein
MQRAVFALSGYDRKVDAIDYSSSTGILEKSLLDKFLEPVIFPFAVVNMISLRVVTTSTY